MFYRICLFQSRDLRDVSADRREILNCDQTLPSFIMPVQNSGAHPQKILEAKTCKIWPNFLRLQNSTANISGMDEDVLNRTSM